MHKSVVIEVENSVDSSASAIIPVSAAREEVHFLRVVEPRETDFCSEAIDRHVFVKIVVKENVGH